jgi:hypothetical protein
MFGKLENEIRALPDQPSLSYDSFGLASEIRPLVGLGHREDKTPRACQSGTPASAHKMNS